VDDASDAPKPAASHRTAVFILIAMAVTIAFYGWQSLRTKQLTITSVSKPGDYVLTRSRTPPSSRWIRVTGWLDGPATLQVSGGLGPVTVGPGHVEWKTGGDWNEGDCTLKYAPAGAATGQLTVEYRIE
jgi:hypothetical protein